MKKTVHNPNFLIICLIAILTTFFAACSSDNTNYIPLATGLTAPQKEDLTSRIDSAKTNFLNINLQHKFEEKGDTYAFLVPETRILDALTVAYMTSDEPIKLDYTKENLNILLTQTDFPKGISTDTQNRAMEDFFTRYLNNAFPDFGQITVAMMLIDGQIDKNSLTISTHSPTPLTEDELATFKNTLSSDLNLTLDDPLSFDDEKLNLIFTGQIN